MLLEGEEEEPVVQIGGEVRSSGGRRSRAACCCEDRAGRGADLKAGSVSSFYRAEGRGGGT
jgi:hypothetical protein